LRVFSRDLHCEERALYVLLIGLIFWITMLREMLNREIGRRRLR
jgi:hypothetical protein